MKNFKHLLSIIILFATFTAFSQHPVIKFDKKTHDFGTFKEEEGSVKARFEFTNIGNADLVIKNVRASCGCTAPKYSKQAVKPGEKGYIEAVYFAQNRPGNFRKSITVTYNNPDKAVEVLFIKGEVIKKRRTRADDFKRAIGSLKLMDNTINFKTLKNTEIKKDSILVYNNSANPMNFSIEKSDECFNVNFTVNPLPPKSEAYIIISFDANKTDSIGNFHSLLTIRTDDKKNPIKGINIIADIEQDFSDLSKRQLKRAPKIKFESTTYDFGIQKNRQEINYKYEFANNGKNDLKILKIESSCACFSGKASQDIISKNSEAYIEASFKTQRKLDKQHYYLKIYTNDPENQVIHLHIQGVLQQ